MSQMNPKEVFHNTEYLVQLPYIQPVTPFKGLKILSENQLEFYTSYKSKQTSALYC